MGGGLGATSLGFYQMFNISFKYFLFWIPILLVISVLAFIDLQNFKDDFISIIIFVVFVLIIFVARFQLLDISSEIEIYLKRNYTEQLKDSKTEFIKETFSPLYFSLFRLKDIDSKLKLLDDKAIKVFLFFFFIQIYLITLLILVHSKT